MPSPEQLAEENAMLRKQLAAQGILIHRQRETIRQVKATKVALVAGQFADEVDPDEEASKAQEFLDEPGETFSDMLAVLVFYAKPGNYPTVIAQDGGKKARDFLKSIGRN